MIEQGHITKKSFIEVKHGDTEVKIKSDNTLGDLAFFAIVAIVIITVSYFKWGRKK